MLLNEPVENIRRVLNDVYSGKKAALWDVPSRSSNRVSDVLGDNNNNNSAASDGPLASMNPTDESEGASSAAATAAGAAASISTSISTSTSTSSSSVLSATTTLQM